jgi:enoyl-CoA hydratase
MLQVSIRDRDCRLHAPEPLPTDAPSDRLARDLIDACREIDGGGDPLSAVVLTGGGGAFWIEGPSDPAQCDRVSRRWPAAIRALRGLTPPTIAVLQGDAIGAAWSVALACDLRLAHCSVRVGHPELRLGRMPVAGGIQRLVQLVGHGGALRLLLAGELLAAEQAHELSLINRVSVVDELEDSLQEMLSPLRSAGPIALAFAKEAVVEGTLLPILAGMRLEADLAALLQTTSDRAEGVGAFLARRRPHFEGH